MISDGEWVYMWTDEMGTGIKYRIGEIKGLTGKVESSFISSGRTVAWQTNVFDVKGQLQDVNCVPAEIPEGKLDVDQRIGFKKRGGIYDSPYSAKTAVVNCAAYRVVPFEECLSC